MAETLDLEGVQQQAIAHSRTLKIAVSAVVLQQIKRQELFSSYWPVLSLRYDYGYAWALDNDQSTVTIGDAISATDLSTWRNSLSLAGNLLLYDGGARGKRQDQAGHGIRAAELALADQRLQLRLQVLDIYAQGVAVQHRLSALNRILDWRKQLYRALKALSLAGTVGETEIQAAALALATDVSSLDDARLQMRQVLDAFANLTGSSYQLDKTLLQDLPSPPETADLSSSMENQPVIKALDAELAALRAERTAAWRDMFPSVVLYGSYRLYGADTRSGRLALEEMQGRDATVAVTMQWEFFSGFRGQLGVQRLDEQIKQLNWQRQQRLAELEQELGGLLHLATEAPLRLEHQQAWLQAAGKMEDSVLRLREQQVLDEPAALTQQIDGQEKVLEEQLRQVRQQASLLRLALLQNAGGV